jgi:signal peptidase I
MRKFFGSLLEVTEVAVIAIVAVLLIRAFLIQPFLVSGDSMVPTFHNGDYLLVDELTYRLREPQRGEVIVFRFPKDEKLFFIKRIIGLPGERVEIADGKVIIVNGEHPQGVILSEPSLSPTLETSGNKDITLGPDQYFVLGDNRSFSLDSRSWGTVAKTEIMGLVRLRLLPLSAMNVFAVPNYGTFSQ